MNMIKNISQELENDLLTFASELVQIQSYTGEEENIIKHIKAKMRQLGYDEVIIDGMGNVIGRIGRGSTKIMFDSHIDTVRVDDEKDWSYPPFSGAIADGKLWGRGSVDMKSGAAASIFAGYAMKKLDLLKDKSIYVSATVMEEDCDGENLNYIFSKANWQPDYVIICEPSGCQVATGHKGKAQIKITTRGISAHGSAPEKGENAVYKMAELIRRVEELSNSLLQKGNDYGTIVLANITCETASLNAIPVQCAIDLDRRLTKSECEALVKDEMDSLIEGTEATWEIGKVYRKSWTGHEVVYEPFHPAWSIDQDHELTKKAIQAYQHMKQKTPDFINWDFSTNAVASVQRNIPTIGFGPGNSKLAHMKNECCPLSEIMDAFEFYVSLVQEL